MDIKRTIITTATHIGLLTHLSRMLGLTRDILINRFIGANALADVFITAYKIPNSLRKIFAEGALSAAFVPSVVLTIQRSGVEAIKGLMTLAFVVFEGICLLGVVGIAWHAREVLMFIAPGFTMTQIEQGVPLLRMLMPLIFFISTNALLAGPLQAIGHFMVPALSPVLLNLVFIGALIICLAFDCSLLFLCYAILAGSVLQTIFHGAACWYYHIRFGLITQHDIAAFKHIFRKFVLCLPSVSIEELNLFIDTSFASYLKPGSVALLYLANRFMGVPLGVVAVSFSTVLLPHFTRIQSRTPHRLSFFLFESCKLVVWIIVPLLCMMGLFAQKIFSTLFLSTHFTPAQVYQAASILWAFLTGLIFYAFNKILLNIYYAKHITFIPAIISLGAIGINFILNWFLVTALEAVGLALASSVAEIVRTFLLIIILYTYYDIRFYTYALVVFCVRYLWQLAVTAIPAICLYKIIFVSIHTFFSAYGVHFFVHSVGFWLWVGPLCIGYMWLLWIFRTTFKIRLFFLD